MSDGSDRFIFDNLGYFIYILDGDTCAHLVVPKIDLAPHFNVLAVSLPALKTVNGALPIIWLDGTPLIDMRGLSVAINSAAPATLRHRPTGSTIDQPDFDWVPDFTQVCCGVTLNPNWRTLPVVDSIIDLGGGALSAVSDEKTCQQISTWYLCDGSEHVQRATTDTAYDAGPAVNDVYLKFRQTTTGTTVAEAILEFDAAVTPTFANIALLGQRMTGQEIDYAHVLATLHVCLPTGDPIRVPKKKVKEQGCKREPRAVPKHPAQRFRNFSILHDGTVECSGPSMRES